VTWTQRCHFMSEIAKSRCVSVDERAVEGPGFAKSQKDL
jgi:hypothetical protein